MKYKITDKNLQTHEKCQWVVGEEKVITDSGNNLCSHDVFHFYDSPELAVLLNPIHANYKNGFKLWEIECDEVIHDRLKGGSKRQTLKKEIAIPVLTVEQRIKFLILCAKKIAKYKSKGWNLWADKWLSGEDISANAAWAAETAASAESAESATEITAASAAIAAWAAETAAMSAASAAWAVASAARAAANTARAVTSAESAEIRKILLEIVEEIK